MSAVAGAVCVTVRGCSISLPHLDWLLVQILCHAAQVADDVAGLPEVELKGENHCGMSTHDGHRESQCLFQVLVPAAPSKAGGAGVYTGLRPTW